MRRPPDTQLPCCKYFPIHVFTFSNARHGKDLQAFPSVMVSLGSAEVCPPSLSSPSHSKSVQISLNQSESTLGCLILITAIHHARNFLPPHVCFDLFLSSAVTVKDEVPCGRTQTAGTGSRAGSQRGAPRPGRRCSSRLHIRAEEERAG